jgi:hypothetical protein
VLCPGRARRTERYFAAGTALSVAIVACSPATEGKYPQREPGCDVQTFTDAPSYATDNIGVVQASCDESVSNDDCLRTLKDSACKLGADTVWGMSGPVVDVGKKKYSGRAAHQTVEKK